MTVSSSTSKNTYSGNGATTAFSFSFPVLDETHFTIQEVNQTTGVVTAKTLTTHYTVSGTGNDSGRTNYTSGTITMLTAPASGVTLVIKRNMPFKQETDYVENDTFPAETHEEALDSLTMSAQQLKEAVDQAVRFDSTVTFTGTLPIPAADKYLKFNSAGTSFEAITLSSTAGLGNVVEDTSPQLGGDLDTNGNDILVGASDVIIFEGTTANAYETTLTVADPTADRTITLPDATTTLIGASTTDTLTNKTINLTSNTLTGTLAQFNTAISDADIVTADSTTSFTNKTFNANGTGNSLTNVDVADLANGTAGQLITWSAAGTPTTVATGTATHVLTSNGAGAAPTFQALTTSATITKATAVATTSGTAVDFTGIPSGVNRITVMFNGVSTNGTSTFLVQIGDGSVVTSGYSSTSFFAAGAGVSATSSTAGFVLNQDSAADTHSGVLEICTLGSNVWVATGQIKANTSRTAFSAGDKTLSGTLDRVRITTTSANTFDAGSVNISYET